MGQSISGAQVALFVPLFGKGDRANGARGSAAPVVDHPLLISPLYAVKEFPLNKGGDGYATTVA